MGQYFLASVGQAEAFRKVGGELQHFFSARTLTDSSINISVSAEEIRGGWGAQLLGQFFHTSVFGLAMTDTMFKLEYIQAQVGGILEKGGYGLTKETVKLGASGSATLAGTPISVLAGTDPIIWYTYPGSTEYVSKSFPAGTTTFSFTVPGGQEGGEICVQYYADRADARKLIVSSDFVPAELVVFLTTRLYAGDASAPETGKPVGSVTIKIPRFQLNGTMDIAMAMAAAATIQIEGTALAYDDDCNGAKYAEIVEYFDVSPYKGYAALVADTDHIVVGDVPVVYATATNKVPLLVNNGDITFSPALANDGTIAAAGEISMSFSVGDTSIEGTFTATDA